MEMGWGELEEVRPTPVWIEVLGKLVFWPIVVALIVAVLVSMSFCSLDDQKLLSDWQGT